MPPVTWTRVLSAERSEAWPCHLLAPALPAEEGLDARQNPPPRAQASPVKVNFNSSLQVTKLAWLNSTSYPGMWLMVAQGPAQGKGRERMLAVVFFFCREGAGPEDSLSSCARQVEERYRAEQPEERGSRAQHLGQACKVREKHEGVVQGVGLVKELTGAEAAWSEAPQVTLQNLMLNHYQLHPVPNPVSLLHVHQWRRIPPCIPSLLGWQCWGQEVAGPYCRPLCTKQTRSM